MPQYLAIIRKAEGTDYWIDVPEVPGCVSRGATPEAAKTNIREALMLHLEVNRPVPPGRRTADQLTEEELEDAVETCIIEL